MIIKRANPTSFSTRSAESNRTLLLVEDDTHLLLSLRMFFQRHGWHILEARSVADGIKLFTANHRHINAVLTDYSFPEGQTGLDLVTHIQMRQPGFPCVVMSAQWSPEKRPKDEPQANLFYRAKPFDFHAMVELVSQVSGVWQRPALAA